MTACEMFQAQRLQRLRLSAASFKAYLGWQVPEEKETDMEGRRGWGGGCCMSLTPEQGSSLCSAFGLVVTFHNLYASQSPVHSYINLQKVTEANKMNVLLTLRRQGDE